MIGGGGQCGEGSHRETLVFLALASYILHTRQDKQNRINSAHPLLNSCARLLPTIRGGPSTDKALSQVFWLCGRDSAADSDSPAF